MDFISILFDFLTKLLQSNPWTTVFAAFVWGILSILLSPCHLSGIPLAIGFINGKGKLKPSRAFFLSLMFAFGILITIAFVGLITGMLGRMFGDIGKIGTITAAVLFILIGIFLLDIIPIPQLHVVHPNMKGKGGAGAFILGLLFGLALGPCSFGFMMPVLLVVFRSASKNIFYSGVLLAAFVLGHAGMIVLAGTIVNWVQNYLNWTEKSKGVMIFRRICGVLVILTGIYLLFNQFNKDKL